LGHAPRRGGPFRHPRYRAAATFPAFGATGLRRRWCAAKVLDVGDRAFTSAN